MHTFSCDACGQLLFFENSVCLRCGRPLGFVTDRWTLSTFERQPDGAYRPYAGDGSYQRCANAALATCNWMVPSDPAHGAATLCQACNLTRGRPGNGDAEALGRFAAAEVAKRRLVFQLHDLGFPLVDRTTDPTGGLAFDLLSSANEPVVTGHDDGVITLDLAESDDAHRTQVQQRLGEPYRTLLGHFRHEIGHYYWGVLVEPNPRRLAACRALFGDDTADYGDAIDQHYAEGPAPGWEQRFVSSYATMHPYEDWAETFAHYLHIRDTLQTAAAFRLMVGGPLATATDATFIAVPAEAEDPDSLAALLHQWLPLTYALNAVNRSMGKDDLYPFVLAPPVVEKLTFVHELWREIVPFAAAAAVGG